VAEACSWKNLFKAVGETPPRIAPQRTLNSPGSHVKVDEEMLSPYHPSGNVVFAKMVRASASISPRALAS
jgi:hypothetical protein